MNRWTTSLLSPRDWVYLFSLLIPFAVYILCLKTLQIFWSPQMQAQAGDLGLMLPDLLFCLGYMLLWAGLFAAARKRWSRGLVVVALHGMTLLVTLLATAAFQFRNITGLALDPNYLLEWIAAPAGTGELIASGISAGILLLILIVVSYMLLGPALLTRFVGHWGDTDSPCQKRSASHWLHIMGTFGMAALLLWAASALPNSSAGANRALSRNAFVDLVIAAAEAANDDQLASIAGSGISGKASLKASLRRTAATRRRNVVLVFFESTRADATTPYSKTFATTPFLQELAEQSLLAEQAYAVVGHTHNALTATNCGFDPPLDPAGTAVLRVPGSLPNICLAHLLKKQGYRTAFFMSHTKAYEDSEAILKNLGYDTFYSVENMETEGFEPTYYWGYEDEIMLEPSARWLQLNRDTPFVAAYLTSAPHHDYLAPQKRHGRVQFTPDDVYNRYLNSVRNQDFFLRSLFEQYKRLGLYEHTIFVILGDHGEAFGEHGIYGHNMIYEEGLRVPLLIHDSERFKHGERVAAPVSQIDMLPTIADLLGYQLHGGDYQGQSLLRPLPNNRTLMFSCWGDQGCVASLKGTRKYLYYFDDKPEELFDLATDPAEGNNLAGAQLREELNARRSELLAWHRQVRSRYLSTAMDTSD